MTCIPHGRTCAFLSRETVSFVKYRIQASGVCLALNSMPVDMDTSRGALGLGARSYDVALLGGLDHVIGPSGPGTAGPRREPPPGSGSRSRPRRPPRRSGVA